MVPLDASNVYTRLWVGGKPPIGEDLPGFDVLVLCAQEIQPANVAFHGRVLRCPIPDGPLDTMQVSRVIGTGRIVAKEIARGQRALVTCAKGLNRSALVASFALAHITRMGANEIMQLMRSRRDAMCLCTPYFQYLLTRLVGEFRSAAIR